MQTFQGTRMATERQVQYMRDLASQREIPAPERLIERLDAGDVTFAQASEYIELMKACPFKGRTVNSNPVTEPGIYEHDGLIYQVKAAKGSGNLYAKVLTMTIGDALRLTAAGSTVKAEYTYDKGAIFKISASDRITGDRAEELSIVFSNCIVCGRHLKAAGSVKAGIGPVCITKV